jgi:hypothetical protein
MNSNLHRQLCHIGPPVKRFPASAFRNCLSLAWRSEPRGLNTAASAGSITTKFPNDGYPAPQAEAEAYRGKPAGTAGGRG